MDNENPVFNEKGEKGPEKYSSASNNIIKKILEKKILS